MCLLAETKVNDMVYQMPKLFPKPDLKNRVICVSGIGGNKTNTAIMTNCIPDLNCLDAGTQCFPLYYYETREKQTMSLFDQSDEREEYVRRDGVSDWILAQAQTRYGKRVTKEDLFYYVYGFLHSPIYRERFAADLKKMLPRLPLVEDVRDFWAFSRIGKLLADLHVDYENVPAPHAERGVRVIGVDEAAADDTAQFRVEQMRFPAKTDKSSILYNSRIRVEGIPAAAYDYVVNGKSAIEWVMERYAPSTHKDSGIHNDPNDWALEQGKPRYILDLLLSVIHLSLKTVELVKQLPVVTFGE
jgi:predicted helicase